MNLREKIIFGGARKTTHEELTRKNDQGLLKKINIYSGLTKEEITKRLEKLYKEWDIERALEVNASALALAGLILNRFSRRLWWVLTGTARGILLQQGCRVGAHQWFFSVRWVCEPKQKSIKKYMP